MKKTTLITVALLTSLTLAMAACGKNSEEPKDNDKPLIDSRGDSARESVNKYVGTALHVKDSAQKQVDASEERQRMMESLGDE